MITWPTVAALIICCICHQCGNCLIEWYFSSKWNKAHKQILTHEKNHDSIHPPSKKISEPISTTKLRKSWSTDNTHSSFKLQPLTQPNYKQENAILRPVTPQTLKDYLSEAKGFNFSSYNNKWAQLRARKDAEVGSIFPLKIIFTKWMRFSIKLNSKLLLEWGFHLTTPVYLTCSHYVH